MGLKKKKCSRVKLELRWNRHFDPFEEEFWVRKQRLSDSWHLVCDQSIPGLWQTTGAVRSCPISQKEK